MERSTRESVITIEALLSKPALLRDGVRRAQRLAWRVMKGTARMLIGPGSLFCLTSSFNSRDESIIDCLASLEAARCDKGRTILQSVSLLSMNDANQDALPSPLLAHITSLMPFVYYRYISRSSCAI